MGKKERQRVAEREARRARKVAGAVATLARRTATLHRDDDARLRQLRREVARTVDALQGSAGDVPPPDAAEITRKAATLASRRQALLIINSKSGPNQDSLTRVRDIAGMLEAAGIQVDVKVKLRKRQARRDARKAARAGVPLVIAAGGDGTVEAVASGLLGSQTALGILPLGTYNNVATSLGIPTGLEEACALIASGPTRAIDVGEVEARGRKKPKLFMEMAGVGLLAALMPVGQDVEKGRWGRGAQALPLALNMSPTATRLKLAGADGWRERRTLLVECLNAPRNGPGMVVAPEARMDDGLLDVRVYNGMDQAALARYYLQLKLGMPPDESGIERLRATSVEVRTDTALPVVADSKVVGSTPARIRVRPGALLVIPGDGFGLERPASPALVDAAVTKAAPLVAAAAAQEEPAEPMPAALPAGNSSPVASVAGAVAPIAAHSLSAVKEVRRAGLPVIAAAAGAAAVPLVRLLLKRLH